MTPIADSWVRREWGYATSHYTAPDFDLGPASQRDLARLVNACHGTGIRFGYDAVMAFAQRAPYRKINFLDFHVRHGVGDPEDEGRDGFGGDLFKYNLRVDGYDPVEGKDGPLLPARQFHKAHIAHRLLHHGVDSIRVDSVTNVANWDFVGELTAYPRSLHRQRSPEAGDGVFLVVGEELAVPIDLVRQHRLDALWNEHFRYLVRSALLGEPGIEETVRRMIDCRRLGFADGAQAVNYLTSHDVEGVRKERLYRFLLDNGIWRTEERIKLAFVCLLTAVGIPMILAGEEFADDHDLPVTHPQKQTDPVFAVNDTAFLHTDLTGGRRVMVWRRGGDGDDPVVVVANFPDWGQGPGEEYVVPDWPAPPPGRRWREVTQDRPVPAGWVARETVYAWQANVYILEPPQ